MVIGARNIAAAVGMSPGAFRMMVSRDRDNVPVQYVYNEETKVYEMAAEIDEIVKYVEERKRFR